jgi:hypothetical protein
MSNKEGVGRSPYAPQRSAGSSAEARRAAMNGAMNGYSEPSEIAAVTSRLERLERFALVSSQQPHGWRDPSLPAPSYGDDQFDGMPAPALLRARRNGAGVSPWLFVMATALNTMVAAVLAVIITLGVVEGQPRESSTAAADGGYTRVGNGAATEAPRLAGTQQGAVTLRPVGSPNEPLRLEARKPARLPLQFQPENAAQDSYIVVLGGAPAGTTLVGASRIGSDTWFLPPGSAERLQITLPEWSSTPFEVAIEVRRTNGLVAAQTKAWLAVPPPGGVSETTGVGTDQSPVKDLLAQGGRLIERGEIIAARSVYERAAAMGSGDAALALGSTYDPNRLWSLGAIGMVGNKERAKHWYARANDLGHPDAGSRLKLLGN